MIARSDRIDETLDVLKGLIEPTCAETGCIRYELHRNTSDPADLTFIEEWTDDDALDAHLASEHLMAAQAKLAELLAEPADIRRYRLVS
ncbi:MAG: putative monooxygenase [Acidobacteria bacterium OLB17]|nr:MAG: putative monooxygenase [Acidobacteria bacterium OLB17]